MCGLGACMILQVHRLRDERRASESDGLRNLMGQQHLATELAAVLQCRRLRRLVAVFADLAACMGVLVVMICVIGVMRLLRGVPTRMGERAERRKGHGNSNPEQEQNAIHAMPFQTDAQTLPLDQGRVKAWLLERGF